MSHAFRARLDRVDLAIALRLARRLMPMPNRVVLAAMIDCEPDELPWSASTTADCGQPVAWWAGMFLDRTEPCVQRVIEAIQRWERAESCSSRAE